MGMCIVDGKLQFFNKNLNQQQQQQGLQQQHGLQQQRGQQGQQQRFIQQQRGQQGLQQQGLQQQQIEEQEGEEQEGEENEEEEYSGKPFQLTTEQKKQLLIMQYLNRQKEIDRVNRINQIKSRKLVFPNPDVKISLPNNRLFTFSGK
jgi:hypothetical protein